MKKINLIFISLLFSLILIITAIAQPPEPPPIPPPIGGDVPEAGLDDSLSAGEENIPETGLFEREGQGEDVSGIEGGGECKPCNEFIQEYFIGNNGKNILFVSFIVLNLILIILNFILIVLLLKFLLNYKKKQTNNNEIQKQSNQKTDSNRIELKNYIKSGLDKGYSPETIKQLLLKNNFPEETIDKALNELKK